MFHKILLNDGELFRKPTDYIFNLLIFSLFLLLGSTSLKAQLCPPTINDPGWSGTQTANFQPYPYEIWGMVNYKYRDFGGRYEIKVDWSTLTNNGRYGVTNDELKQIMYKAIIVSIAGRDCEHLQGQKQFVFFEVTECKETRHCYLHLKKDQEVFCNDDGWPGPNPEYYTYQNEHYYKLSNSITCGTQCCEYVYTVECTQKPQGGGNYAHIISFSKNPYPGSSCPAGLDTDFLTGEPEPCVSTCN